MKKNYTKIVFVVDRSGSMSSIATDMIGGYNTFIKSQKELKHGTCDVSFYQFDEIYEKVYENVDINDVKDLTDKTYVPRGMTALYDGIGKTINALGETLKNMEEKNRPEKILFVIITDGAENSSKEFTSEKIKEMITHQSDVYKWEFSYIGANQDAWEVGGGLGIKSSSTMTWTNNVMGTNCLFNSLADSTTKYRCSNTGSYSFSASDINAQKDAKNGV